MKDERFKKPYDNPPLKKDPRFKEFEVDPVSEKKLREAIHDVCKIMRERKEESYDMADEYIKEKYNPQPYIVLPKWAYKLAANYRGNIVVLNEDGTAGAEVVVRGDGTIYLQ